MTYPPSIPLRPLTFGAAFVMEDGDAVAMTVRIKSSKSLVWRATGSPLITVAKTFTNAEGMQGTFEIPATDQEGWGDGNGHVIDVSGGGHTHLYTANITYALDGATIGTATVGPFALPLEDGSPVDIDDMLPVTTESGLVVLIPDSWSDQVDAAEAAALAAEAAIPLGGTTGQVLAKASNADRDTEWVDQTGGTGGGGPADWDEITDKPAFIAAGATAPAARGVIGAGTSSLTIGTTGTSAKAGNWTPTIDDLPVAVPIAMNYADPRADDNIARIGIWFGGTSDDPQPAGMLDGDFWFREVVTP